MIVNRLPILLLLVSCLVVGACGPEKSDASSSGEASPSSTSGEAGGTMPTSAPKPLDKRIKDAIDRGIRVIRSHQDPKTGAVSFARPYDPKMRHPGITALAVLAYLRSPRHYRSEDGPFVRAALEWLASLQKPDGSIFERDSANYVTSIAVMALQESGEARFRPVVEKALDWLVRMQCREDTGYRPGDRFYGGVGYGGDERPDLSNTQFALEAAHEAGLPKDHPFWKRARVFLQRSQNWSETNDQVWKDAEGHEVRPGNDGGAIYFPGESKSGVEVLPDGTRVFRSYGSMSYALLKSYIFTGLDRRDPRVRAVQRWCVAHFDLDRHPGFLPGPKGNEPYQGLYYYYYSMARCLGVLGDRFVASEDGTRHDWPAELAEKLLSLEKHGVWRNDKNSRWQEGSPVLCTCYAVLALEECLAALKK
ncbi:MAG TPA: hypothetical protein ENK43_10915 [Planctomycetes bacterium]|nr:hypothetical protein [Planctomycetota bacterium]